MGVKNITYDSLLTTFDEKTIHDRYVYLQLKAEEFIKRAGYEKTVTCNDRILRHVIVDYFEDIRRLKDFHGIEFIKTDKIAAYTIAWWLRRKPIQFKESCEEEKDIFVNERFALSLMLNECFEDEELPLLSNDNMNVFQKYLDYLLYYFKYRYNDAKVIELMMESFKMGLFVWKNRINTSDNP